MVKQNISQVSHCVHPYLDLAHEVEATKTKVKVAGSPPAIENAPAVEVEVADANIDATVRDEDPYIDP